MVKNQLRSDKVTRSPRLWKLILNAGGFFLCGMLGIGALATHQALLIDYLFLAASLLFLGFLLADEPDKVPADKKQVQVSTDNERIG